MKRSIRGRRSVVGLAGLGVLVGTAAWVGARATRPGLAGWYQGLRKPAFTPPNWIFGPAWSALYAVMTVAAWLVWRERGPEPERRRALAAFFVQLGLNALWSLVFFGGRRPGAALVEIGGLWLAVAATAAMFRGVRPAAGALFLPYLVWVTYATALNAEIWRLNRDAAPGSGRPLRIAATPVPEP